jgi:hypothetical protein
MGTDCVDGLRYIRRVTRTRAFRTLAGVIAVWLGICLAEPMQLHLCVMHGGLAIQSGAHSGSHSHNRASHANHGSHSGNDHEKTQQCSCLGDCTTGSAPAFINASQVAVALPVGTRAVVTSGHEPAAVVAIDFLLPFSNGPPGTSSLA